MKTQKGIGTIEFEIVFPADIKDDYNMESYQEIKDKIEEYFNIKKFEINLSKPVTKIKII